MKGLGDELESARGRVSLSWREHLERKVGEESCFLLDLLNQRAEMRVNAE